ncbi:hypothetical protein ACSL103130_10920 [Actinomyces slackii]|uniref:Uncharacterized protein n=1 Tax=Actinomyces slackii TaxID=52774 RepID=A0A3S4SR19_9ACTO|nr:Uncharacterised protein [Actinomyces slackii]
MTPEQINEVRTSFEVTRHTRYHEPSLLSAPVLSLHIRWHVSPASDEALVGLHNGEADHIQ